ncbi:MAG: di-trans,poly-cis-decaprenylcistransferase, partial [Spirochaetes bacterium]|nr:di-trans,poly-cis-decaprenylcistransferase [Spirochaetota bacterium]
AIIMDGNGRWAKKKGMPRNVGHKAGVEKAKEIVLAVKELKIPFISMYTFSKENWKRSQKEVSFLMNLIISHLEKEFDFYIKNKIRIIHIGDRVGLPDKVLKAIDRVQVDTKEYKNPTLLLALNYSGKHDIIQAVNKIQKENIAEINEDIFSKYLLTADFPDPDLIVRTSGEFRISNYFLWQAAYSEFYIVNKHWPDFEKDDLVSIIEDYYNRDRRFGGIKNE